MDTNIILLNVNIVYGIDFLETILEIHKNNPTSMIQYKNKIIYLQPSYITKNIMKYKPTSNNTNLNINQWLIQNKSDNINIINLKYSENYKSL
jgi:hypothetical protein